MKSQVFDVKSKSKKVAEVEVPVYDSLDEAVKQEGETKVLSYFNSQLKTNIMNEARAAATSEPSKKQLRNMAMAELSVEEFQQVAGDPQALERLIDQKAEEIRKRKAEEAAQAAAHAQEEGEDEDEDD